MDTRCRLVLRGIVWTFGRLDCCVLCAAFFRVWIVGWVFAFVAFFVFEANILRNLPAIILWFIIWAVWVVSFLKFSLQTAGLVLLFGLACRLVGWYLILPWFAPLVLNAK